MSVVRIEKDISGAIKDYVLAREMRWYPGSRNLRLTHEGKLPVMWVRRSIVLLGKIYIPLIHAIEEVPEDIAKAYPIPLRRDTGDCGDSR